jgi:biopolymer transport protein ExbB
MRTNPTRGRADRTRIMRPAARRHGRDAAPPRCVGVALALMLLMPAAVRADDSEPAPIPATFAYSDLPWWLLLGLTVVVLVIVFEGLLTARRGRIAPASTAEALTAAIRTGSLDAALRLGDDPSHDAMLTRVVLAGVRRARDHADATADQIQSAARDEGEALAARLYRRADILGTIGAVMPLIGLLGTALSLTASLGRLAAAGDATRAADIAAAAGSALDTTVLGLLVAIPSLVAANWVRARLDTLTREMGRQAEQVLNPLGRR